jgi:hypothetical protein
MLLKTPIIPRSTIESRIFAAALTAQDVRALIRNAE